jgi:WD40 repeat protein
MLTNGQEDRASSTVEILADAYQFARHNQYMVDLAPLQLYASALVFAPDLSLIKTLFKSCMPSWLSSRPRIEGTWRSDVLKFEGHTSFIKAITFSPDDKLLGTCSKDGTARVWHITDASCSLTVSHDKHFYSSSAIAFSLDNSKVAVAYVPFGEYAPINVVDTINVVVTIYAKTGMPLRTMQCPGLLLGHRSRLALAFADDEHHDAIVLAVADIDHVQVLRPVNDSNILIRAWTSHFPNQGIYKIAVALSQDASLLCCSGILEENDCGEFSISVLDPKTGVVTSKHSRDTPFGDLKFSGRTLVYQTTQEEPDHSSLMGFDLGNPGASTHLLGYHGVWRTFSLANAKNRVAFNPIDNNTVHVEAISVGKRVGRRIRLLDRKTVAVAPRGNLVADWNDGCLTVLDTKGLVTQTIMATFEGVRCLAISPDCRYIALGHDEGATVWNMETGQHSQYNGIKDQIELAFSDDNKMLACVAVSDISVWDLESQMMLSSTAARGGSRWRRRRLEFSADGQDLLTRRGRFHIATATLTKRPESTTSSVFGKEIDLFGGELRVEWVRFYGEDLLWIPDEYRTDSKSDARGNVFALGQEDGSVMVLTFDLSML